MTWTLDGDTGTNPLYHWFALFAGAAIGPDLDDGLANLKTLAEKN